MKNVLKILGIACFAFIAFSCSSDDDPADDDIFAGTYKGSISYKSDDQSESYDDGKVTVVKFTENKYNFKFSDGIPNLTGVKFEEDGDNKLINVDFENGIQYIRINESTLKMHYSKDGKTWEGNLER